MDVHIFFNLICAAFSFSALFSMYHTVSGTSFIKFSFDNHFDGYRCKQSETVFELKNLSRLRCAKACFLNRLCYSAFYHVYLEECIGCEGFYHKSVIFKDSEYIGRYSGECMPLWTEINGECFYISSHKTNWTDAVIECKIMGSHLIHPGDTFNEYNLYHPLVQAMNVRLVTDPNTGYIVLWKTMSGLDILSRPDMVFRRTVYPVLGYWLSGLFSSGFLYGNGHDIVGNNSWFGNASAKYNCTYYDIDLLQLVAMDCGKVANFICLRKYYKDDL